ncbi:MAG TPA: hypothetical protein VI583_12285 [Cyclobacteriaceae bacterium]|nr:hypothetical protein [Cyclobacteriaceae bacterium]
MKKNQQKPGRPGANPNEQFSMENELLKLKLMAENGAEFGSVENIDPSIENVFLKNVIEFERQFAQGKRITVFEMIGKPAFRSSGELTDDELGSELNRINEILEEHSIGVDFMTRYPDREKYRFIVEELFREEMDDISIPGMVHQFIYEEYHPNHTLYITNRAMEFIKSWFSRKFNEYGMALADQWVTDQGSLYQRNEVLDKFGAIFEKFRHFKNVKFKILDVHPDVREGEETGMGYAEGIVKYDALKENGENVHFEGPFKLYMRLSYGGWSIFFAIWPGLEW